MYCGKCRYGSDTCRFKDYGNGPKCPQCGNTEKHVDKLEKKEPKTLQRVNKKFELEAPHSEIKGIDYRAMG